MRGAEKEKKEVSKRGKEKRGSGRRLGGFFKRIINLVSSLMRKGRGGSKEKKKERWTKGREKSEWKQKSGI